MISDMPMAGYLERSAKQKAAATTAEWEHANQLFEVGSGHVQAIADNSIGAVNIYRELGLHLQGICGHKQMQHEFWRDHCAGKAAFTEEQAKGFIAIANRTPEPVTKLSEAVHLIQMCLITADLLQLSERAETQRAHEFDALQRFVNEFTCMRQQLVVFTRQTPMEQWSRAQLKLFLSETQWLEDERQRARKLHEKA